MSKIFEYFDTGWRQESFACVECGWSGRVDDMSLDLFQDLTEHSCSRCFEIMVPVSHPTLDQIREAAAAGDQEAIAWDESLNSRAGSSESGRRSPRSAGSPKPVCSAQPSLAEPGLAAMTVRLVWPDCDLDDGRARRAPVDSFWVQAERAEAEACIVPFMPEDASLDDRMAGSGSADCGPGYCFLVSRDLQSIAQMQWYFPFSGLWNAYSPFREFPEPVEISSLEELGAIEIPPDLRG